MVVTVMRKAKEWLTNQRSFNFARLHITPVVDYLLTTFLDLTAQQLLSKKNYHLPA